MGQPQYTSLCEAIATVPDPRKARGRRYFWVVLLTVIAAGLASGQQTARAIAQWLYPHAIDLKAALPQVVQIPSESTILRPLRLVDVAALEAAIAQLVAPHTHAQEAPRAIVTPLGTRSRPSPLMAKPCVGPPPAVRQPISSVWFSTVVASPSLKLPLAKSGMNCVRSPPCWRVVT